MNISKLNIVNGIIQDETIDGIPVVIDIVEPKGKANVRTLIPIEDPEGLTYHNTANTSPSATDSAHATYFQSVENADKSYVGAMLFVDQDSITQVLPLNEASYHTSDKVANRTTYSIEICENGDTDITELNAKKLGAALILTYPNLNLYTHKDWTGKNCPRVILNRGGWSEFKESIYSLVNDCTEVVESDDEGIKNLIARINELETEVKELKQFKTNIEEAIAG